jgi:endoglucanase
VIRSLVLSVLLLAGLSSAPAGGWIRVNQIGYLPSSIKVAVLVSKDSTLKIDGFQIIDQLTAQRVYRSAKVSRKGPYGPFAAGCRLDFSGFSSPGAYYIEAGGVRSPGFRIARDVYDGTADFLLRYMRQQRSGYNPFLNDSCHTSDGYIIYHPTLDSTHIDVSGGWHDAADYLQYVTTSANAVFQMLFAYERNPGAFGDTHSANGRPGPNGIPDILDEARWGIQWLLKMNPSPDLMFNQLADDRDHLGFRLPTLDTVSYGKGKERPVYFCSGEPQGVFQYKNRTTGVASTAGKFSSAFALGSLVFRNIDPALSSQLGEKAMVAYRLGVAKPGVCQTAPCRAPYFYEEDNWVDDMELAAIQLHRLTGEREYLKAARQYGAQEPVTPWMGAESARHYQWYPFLNLGHLYTAGEPALRKQFLGYLREGLRKVHSRGKGNPFLFGVPFIWCSNNLVSAMVTQARVYRELSGDRTFAEMEAALLDWLFGCNPWGTSMIVGLPADGVSPRDPHSAFTHVHGYPIDGGLVDGPVYTRIFESLKGVRLAKSDPFAEFQSPLAVYHDDWADYSSNEPTMDGTASLTYILSAMQSEGALPHAVKQEGGIIRFDTTKKVIRLAFTGHEYADGAETIRNTLKRHGIRASFFFTGDFYRTPAFRPLIAGLKADGHYLGPHSDKHLLYAFWDKRDSSIISREVFLGDLRANYDAMAAFGVQRSDAPYLMPPYEWYNRQIAVWAAGAGVTVVNFTPGTTSNADYTTPDMGARYVSSDSISSRILSFERRSGLNGFVLLTHIGTDPKRTDKFYRKLDALLSELKKRGYRFARL